MTGALRRALLAPAAVLALAALTGVATPVTAAAATAPARATAATVDAGGLATFKGCIAARGDSGQKPTVRLAVVIDESGSLRDSDPGNARVTAAKVLVDQLAAQAGQEGFTVSALVAGFSGAVDNSTGFSDLTTANVGGFTSAIDAFAGRNTGQDTDYWAAMQQIRTLFADARGGADPTDPKSTPCQAAVLVTDGQFDLSVRNTTKPYPGVENVAIDSEAAKDRVVAAGVTDLCRTAGPVDALRADDVTLIAVGLKGNQSAPDFSLLQRMATGSPSACGAQPPNGAFYEADDVSDLVLILATVGTGDQPTAPVVNTVCPRGTVDAGCTRTFALSPAFTSAKLLTAVDVDGVGVQITTADGQKPAEIDYTAAATQGQVSVNGVQLAYQWYSPRALSVQVTGRESPSWNGTWSATFVDTTGKAGSAKAKTQLSVQPDLFVDASVPTDDQDAPRPGETATIGFALRNGLDQTVTQLDPGLTVQATASVTSKTAGSTPVVVRDAFTAADLATPYPWKVPSDLPVGPALLSVTTTVTYAGNAYAPTTRQELIDVKGPFTAPSVDGSVTFPLVDGTRTVSGDLRIQAPRQGSGCVWVDGATLTAAPAALTSVDVASDHDSESSCQSVDAGSAGRTLTLRFTPGAESNGDVTGTVDVHLAPQGGGAPSVVKVRFAATVERSVQGGVFWAVVGGAVLLSVLIPALVYALVRRRGARFPSQTLHLVVCPAQVTGTSLAVGRDVQRQVLVVDPSRRSARGGDHSFRSVVGWRPTEAGHGLVTRSGWVGVGGVSPYRRESAAVLPVALAGSWAVFVPDHATLDETTTTDAELLLVIPAAASDDRLQQLREQAASEFHRRHAVLVEGLPDRTPELVGVGAGAGTGEPGGGTSVWGTSADPTPPAADVWPTSGGSGAPAPERPGRPPAGGGPSPSAPGWGTDPGSPPQSGPSGPGSSTSGWWNDPA